MTTNKKPSRTPAQFASQRSGSSKTSDLPATGGRKGMRKKPPTRKPRAKTHREHATAETNFITYTQRPNEGKFSGRPNPQRARIRGVDCKPAHTAGPLQRLVRPHAESVGDAAP